MKTPLQRVREGAIVLTAVFAIAVVGYRYIGGMNWVDALWIVVITVSTVGYGEVSAFDPELQLFTIGVILFGMTASFYTFGGLIQLMFEGELERVIGRRRMAKEIQHLHDHIVICGYGRIGQHLAGELKIHKRPIVVIDKDPRAVTEARSLGILAVEGDATEEEVLRSLHVETASTLVAGLPSDAESVFITLTARNLNRDIQIIARAEFRSTERKLRQAGADKVVLPTVIGARQMVRMITRPSTADLIEMVNESSFTELELEEFLIEPDNRLSGVSVRETEELRRHKLLVVAVKDADGHLIFSPTAEHRFNEGDTVMLMGHAEDIEQFCSEFLE